MGTFKIIARSNFDDETVSDLLIADNITSKYYGEKMIKSLNGSDMYDKYIYELVSSDYKLYEWEP